MMNLQLMNLQQGVSRAAASDALTYVRQGGVMEWSNVNHMTDMTKSL
jgi:hypothetical protein